MNEESQKTWISGLLREHPALLASMLYLAASAIGMFYSWAFFREFGINVFNFAQIGDFLLASLKEPVTWLLVAVAIVSMVGENAMSRRYQKKNKVRWLRWYGSRTYRMLNYFVLVVMIALFLFLYADKRANEIREGEGEHVRVLLADGNSSRDATLLGTTGQFIFLYDSETGVVDIHPNENVQTISQAPE